MIRKEKYDIQLPQFEGPFDLLLFFIERDELDIYDISIGKITHDFLAYLTKQELMNIELSSDFIFFASKLIHIKARTLFPRKEKNEDGEEIDPRQDFIQQLAAYKQYKEIAGFLSERESERMQLVARGNVASELQRIGEQEAVDNHSELHTLTLPKLLKAFERILSRLHNQSVGDHVVYEFPHTMESCREYVANRLSKEHNMPFDSIFQDCTTRIHAVFLFLSILELIQLSVASLLLGAGRNNFIIEYCAEEKILS